MTIAKFVEIYSKDSLYGKGLNVGTTTLRNYLLKNKEDFEKDEIVKFTKKISSIGIDIKDAEALYKKLA